MYRLLFVFVITMALLGYNRSGNVEKSKGNTDSGQNKDSQQAKKTDDGPNEKSNGKTKQQPNGNAEDVKVDQKPDFKLTARELIKEVKNKDAALAKYKDKVLSVTGRVSTVTPAFVEIVEEDSKEATDGIFPFTCKVQPQFQAKMHRFSKNQHIEVIGRFPTEATFGFFELKGCVVKELEPSKLQKITADDVVAASDAGKKLGEHGWIISGVVAEVKKHEQYGATDVVYLKTKGKTRLRMWMGEMAPPKVGEKAEFRGWRIDRDKTTNELEVNAILLKD